MNKLQENTAGKVLAAVAMLVLTFACGMCSFRVLASLPYAEADSWQTTSRFYNLLSVRQNQLAGGVACTLELEQNQDLTYLERQQLQTDLDALYESMAADSTWFRFQLLTADGKTILATNLAKNESLNQVVDTIHYSSFTAGDYVISSETAYTSYAAETSVLEQFAVSLAPSTPLVLECGVPMELSDGAIQDEFYKLATDYSNSQSMLTEYMNGAFILGALACLCLLYLLWTSGHKAGLKGIALSWQERIYLEVYLLVMVAVGTAAFLGILYLGEYFYMYTYYQGTMNEELFILANEAASALAAVLIGVIALTLRTLAVRLRAGCLTRTTLVCRVCGWLARTTLDLARSIPFLWKTLAAFLLYFFLNVMLFDGARYSGLAAAAWWLLNLGVLLLLCWWSMGFRRLRKGGHAISTGNLDYQVDTRRMPHDLRSCAEDLNNISVGMAEAVQEQMKSERFKAELITNVSHDLKTPLTSIINYVDLLKTTEQSDPKAQEYIEVLDRKSQRLKKLTEDLVEASKASTGVLSVNREKIGMAQLMDQALGEWTERLEGRRLSVVTSVPEGETWVYADGRHLWRVIDNLLSNCAKYAMEGTRVYLDLARGKGQVILSVKNISREPLNVPPDRLIERFVRGEESRSTEGSGLGLSIARSLTELQGGTFELTVDGDLFKATVTMPQAN